MYNNSFMCYNSCPTPTPNSFPTPPPGFKKRDNSYSTYGDQAHKSRYALATRKLLANMGVPTWQPPPKSLISTINTNLANIREWAILDSRASSHVLQVDAPLLQKKKTVNRMVRRQVAHMKDSSMLQDYQQLQGMHM